ncbi:hypothetical protein SKAU_G00024820 [Synaphobranchus kaupii]|uniref:Ataxin-7-like protein 1 n=1 Tax=Synaphobranchus kaupii TaxID=118154 RepID=A0A9Q1JF19_SYNKA|nr:hypothetical protein SKAU_G00024820 [Synaphobranchus kaupii]
MLPLSLGEEGGGRLSSDDDEVAVPGESERPDCHCSPRHPRPMGCCSFGSRLMGQGHYVFDRRWDRTRLALHRMVEKHVNSLMWRKIPLADESPTPSPGAIPATQSFLSPSPSSSFGISPPLLSPPAAFVGPSDGVSMTSYSATFPHGSGGVFSIMDTSSLVPPFPALSAVSSQGARPRAKPSRPPKAHDQASAALGVTAGGTMGGALGGAEGGAVRGRKKKPPLSCAAAHKRNSITAAPPLNPHPAGPAFCSNGTPAHCAKTEPSPHAGDFATPYPLPGDHALSVHSPPPLLPGLREEAEELQSQWQSQEDDQNIGAEQHLEEGRVRARASPHHPPPAARGPSLTAPARDAECGAARRGRPRRATSRQTFLARAAGAAVAQQ